MAFLHRDRRELARAVRRLLDYGYPIDHATDHGATESFYLSDPVGNGVELYYDRPSAAWFHPDGRPLPKARRFDPEALLEPLDERTAAP